MNPGPPSTPRRDKGKGRANPPDSGVATGNSDAAATRGSLKSNPICIEDNEPISPSPASRNARSQRRTSNVGSSSRQRNTHRPPIHPGFQPTLQEFINSPSKRQRTTLPNERSFGEEDPGVFDVEQLSQGLPNSPMHYHESRPLTPPFITLAGNHQPQAIPNGHPATPPNDPAPRFPPYFLAGPPDCKLCNIPCILRPSQRRRSYYVCPELKHPAKSNFVCWDDNIGIAPDNPRCGCELPSRVDIITQRPDALGNGFWTCASRRCGFYSEDYKGRNRFQLAKENTLLEAWKPNLLY